MDNGPGAAGVLGVPGMTQGMTAQQQPNQELKRIEIEAGVAAELKQIEIEAGVAAEVKRHNIEMEGIERKKFAATSVDAARTETTYSLGLIRDYNTMRQEYPTYTVKDSAKMFPQFIVCFTEEDLLNVSEEDKEKLVNRFNKWNEDRGLKSRLDSL